MKNYLGALAIVFAGLVISATPGRPLVGAYYFGIYTDEQSWEGIAGRYGMPALGFYQLTDPAVMRSHIETAQQAGLDFFNFYWYWRYDREAYAQLAIRTFLSVDSAFPFMLSICAHPWDNLVIPPAYSTRAISTLVDYVASPRYLRLSSGRPVIEILDSRGIYAGTADSTNLFIYRLSRAIYLRLGTYPVILINAELPFSRQVNAEAYTCHAPHVEVYGSPYQQHIRSMYDFYALFTDKPFAPCVVSYFDEGPRLGYAIQDPQAIRHFTDWAAQDFLNELQLAYQMASSAPSEVGQIVMITTWNDHHEQTAIEPLDNDRRRLELVSLVFGN